MGCLVLTRKLGEIIVLTEACGRKTTLTVLGFNNRELNVESRQDGALEVLRIGRAAPQPVAGGTLSWSLSSSFSHQVRMAFDLPRTVNIARSEIAR
jgi:sRNA-binding carbon storage regulator CsrA